ncbi:thiamine pyrophosphate-dependent enzyme, partial [Escherichia sp. HC-CC]
DNGCAFGNMPSAIKVMVVGSCAFSATYPGKINFMQIAAGFGLETCDLNNEADPQAALQEIINRPGPALIHVRIDAEEKVYPMVPPGAANTEMVGE